MDLDLQAIRDRLRARIIERHGSLAGFARDKGIPVSTIGTHLDPGRGLPLDQLDTYARLLRRPLPWLLFGGDAADLPPQVPLVGTVGAGEPVFSIDDHEPGQGHEMLDGPPGTPEDAMALEVRGDSMFPAYREGDRLFFRRLAPDEMSRFLHQEVVARTRDGRTLVKTLERGSGRGLWTLGSHNAQPIEDVDLEWIGEILWHDKRRRGRSVAQQIVGGAQSHRAKAAGAD